MVNTIKSQNVYVVRLEKEVCELKELLRDHRASQININAQMLSELDVLKMWKSRFSKMFLHLKKLNEKCKEQRIEMNLLKELFVKGRDREVRKNCVSCECGQRVDLIEEENVNDKSTINQEIDVKKIQSVYFEVKETQTEDNLKQQNCSYSTDLRPYIGQLIMEDVDNESRTIGPVIGLFEDGECHFQLSNNCEDSWTRIRSRSYYSNEVWSKPILLPDELQGLILRVWLCGIQNPDQFQIRLDTVDCQINKRKVLPVTFHLQIKVTLLNGEYCISDNHRFTIDKIGLDCYAKPNNFIASCSNTHRKKLPEIILKFSQ